MEHLDQYGAIYAAAFSGEPWNDNWSVKDAANCLKANNITAWSASWTEKWRALFWALPCCSIMAGLSKSTTLPLRHNTNAKGLQVDCSGNASMT